MIKKMILHEKNAPQARFFMKYNAPQARLIKQNAPQAENFRPSPHGYSVLLIQ